MTVVNGSGGNGRQQRWRAWASWTLGAILVTLDLTVYVPGEIDPVLGTLCLGLFGLGGLERLRK